MKPLSDIAQIILSLSGWLGFLGCFILALLLIQAMRIFALLWKWTKKALAFIFAGIEARTPKRLFVTLLKQSAKISLLALPIFFLRLPISDGLQWVEQRYLYPVEFTSDTSEHVLAVYEMELARYCDPYECEIVKRRTREIATKIGSTPLSIYEVAYSECGMNPFCVRKDGVAAGWIQFTRSGLTGLGVSLPQVKAACYQRNTNLIMDLTESYLVDRAKGKQMPRSCDVYTCVFAPGYLGYEDDATLYSIQDGDAYTLNSGLDGYFIQDADGTQIVMNTRKARDGRITINDLKLALAYKKSSLLKKYQN